MSINAKVRDLVHRYHEQRWLRQPEVIPELYADSRVGVYDLIREHAGVEASDGELYRALMVCGYRVLPAGGGRWSLSS